MSRLAGKVALITGGAGAIGFASAQAMVAEGARVFLVDLDSAALERAAEALGAQNAAWAAADVTDGAQIASAVDAAVERFGGLHVAFANAGIFGTSALVTDYPDDVFEAVLRVNVLGVFITVKHALRVMGPGASVIINSSVVGLTSAPQIAGYATSKHAVVGLMRTAAKENATKGIRVNTIHPGPVSTGFQEAIEVAVVGAPAQEAAAFFDTLIPMARHASAEEIGMLVVYLASDESAFMTGATIAIDGGVSI